MDYKLFVGIDQSKLTFDAAIIQLNNPDQSNHQQFQNDKKGFKKFLSWVKSIDENLNFSQILFCSENTGWYGYQLNLFLLESKASLWVESALQIKLSTGVKRGKTDKSDSQQIAQYCYLHRQQPKLYVMPDKKMIALKQLLAYREQLIRQQTSLSNCARGLSSVDGEASSIINKKSQSLRKLLQKEISSLDEKMLEIIESEKELKQKFTLTTSVHGIGKQTALYMLVYTNGFTLFDDWKKFACYCGAAPFDYSSGTSIRKKTRVSSLGNKKFKSLLTLCALNTLRKDNELKQYYDRRCALGKPKMSTINVLRNKLISRVFAVVKRGTPYKPNYTQIAMA